MAGRLTQAEERLAATTNRDRQASIDADTELQRLRERVAAAEEARSALELGRRTAIMQTSKVKEELAEMRHRLAEAEATARLAEEGRLEYVARINEAEAETKKMRTAMIQAREGE